MGKIYHQINKIERKWLSKSPQTVIYSFVKNEVTLAVAIDFGTLRYAYLWKHEGAI